MLPELIDLKNYATLVSNTGIQFIDFGFKVEAREPSGQFAQLDSGHLALLAEDDSGTFYSLDHSNKPESRKPINSSYDLRLQDSLSLLDKQWLPLPYFRYSSSRFDNGPSNWARVRFIELDNPDFHGNTHRVTLAFDTNLMPYNEKAQYLGPTQQDVDAPAIFKLGIGIKETNWFFDLEWVSEWLIEIYTQANSNNDPADIKDEIRQKYHIAHYMNLLKLLSPISEHRNNHVPKVELPDLKVVCHTGDGGSVIPVDLVIDVGNSRTCGILIENHGQENSGMMSNYLLHLRDLSSPEKLYSEPFDSRIEFSQAFFGKNNFSRRSGRNDAFLWPTFSRVGVEANNLASCRLGSEGSTGLSSPKRYLWDKSSYNHGWVLNGGNPQKTPDKAMVAPFSKYIDGNGEAIYKTDGSSSGMPVIDPKYSRSSLMTFMLAEIIAHALNQINSVGQRKKLQFGDRPRVLSSITLTIPPGMPLAERAILSERLNQALALVWQCMGWLKSDDDPFDDKFTGVLTVDLPERHIKWDEASCGQLVYLYTEIVNNFAQKPEEYFASLSRADKSSSDNVTLATIDIGGGTTDLVITNYRLSGRGSNAHIIPTQLFRDGFKIAGDDILLDVIQQFILPELQKGLAEIGVASLSLEDLMSNLCGSESLSASESVLRQQLNLQFFTPLGLAILRIYESYDPYSPDNISREYKASELLPELSISEQVQDYVNDKIKRSGCNEQLDLNSLNINLNFKRIHQAFLDGHRGFNIAKSLYYLSEVVFRYKCDKLLLTGRPSKLPGIQALMRQLMPVSPGRILPMHNYVTGHWYPFHKNLRIDDPKTTASVGALLCILSHKNRIQNFFFRSMDLKPYSTIRVFGIIDGDNTITKSNVLFSDIKTEDLDGYEKIIIPIDPETGNPPLLDVRGPLRLGYRQLDTPRWTASPLYTIQFTDDGNERYNNAKLVPEDGYDRPVVRVEFAVKRNSEADKSIQNISDELEIARVETKGTSTSFNKGHLTLELNTMLEAQSNQKNYWLDSGSVK